MSRQSKARRQSKLADQITALHKSGQRGPSQTKPLHGKSADKVWHKNRQAWYARNTPGSKSVFRKVA